MVVFFSVPIGGIFFVILSMLGIGISAAKSVMQVMIVAIPCVLALMFIGFVIANIIMSLRYDENGKKGKICAALVSLIGIAVSFAIHFYMYKLLDFYARDFLARANNGIWDNMNTIFNFIFVSFVGGLLYAGTSVFSVSAAKMRESSIAMPIVLDIIAIIPTILLALFTNYAITH